MVSYPPSNPRGPRAETGQTRGGGDLKQLAGPPFNIHTPSSLSFSHPHNEISPGGGEVNRHPRGAPPRRHLGEAEPCRQDHENGDDDNERQRQRGEEEKVGKRQGTRETEKKAKQMDGGGHKQHIARTHDAGGAGARHSQPQPRHGAREGRAEPKEGREG